MLNGRYQQGSQAGCRRQIVGSPVRDKEMNPGAQRPASQPGRFRGLRGLRGWRTRAAAMVGRVDDAAALEDLKLVLSQLNTFADEVARALQTGSAPADPPPQAHHRIRRLDPGRSLQARRPVSRQHQVDPARGVAASPAPPSSEPLLFRSCVSGRRCRGRRSHWGSGRVRAWGRRRRRRGWR